MPLRVLLGVAGLAVLVSAGLIAFRGGDESPSPNERPPLSTSEGRIVDARGAELLLRGFNAVPVVSERPIPTWDVGHYRRMAKRGFNVVRFVLDWPALEPERGRFDRKRLAALDTSIGHARRARMHVVLDLVHVFRGEDAIPQWARTGEPIKSIERNAGDYFRAVARRYRSNPAVAAYDPVNEPPTAPIDQNRVLRMYARIVREIRSVDPSKAIMFEPSYGDSSMKGADLSLLGDRSNLIFSMHDYYAGGAGAGYLPGGEQNNQFGGSGSYTWNGRTGYENPDPTALEQHLLVNLKIMQAAEIPVWIGEFGVSPTAPGAKRWIGDKVALFKRYRLGYAWWLYGPGGGTPTLDARGRFLPFVRDLR